MKRFRLATVLLLGAMMGRDVRAATSFWTGPGSDFGTAANWMGGVPTDVAEFDTAAPQSIAVATNASLNEMAFNPSAAAYTFAIAGVNSLVLTGVGITNSSSHDQTFNVTGALSFNNSASAGSGTTMAAMGGGQFNFFNTATAGQAAITANAGTSINFANTATAGNSTLTTVTAGAGLNFFQNSTAGSATIMNQDGATVNARNSASLENASITNTDGAGLNLFNASTAGNAIIINDTGGETNFTDTATAGHSVMTIDNSGSVNFTMTATAGDSTITANDTALVSFGGHATAGRASITNNSGAVIGFSGLSTAGNAVIWNQGGETDFGGTASGGNAAITNSNSGTTNFGANSTAANAVITNTSDGFLNFGNSASAGSATIINNNTGGTEFDNASTAANATITNNGGALIFTGTSNAGQARIVNNGGDVDFAAVTSGNVTAGSIEGNGSFELGNNTLTMGSNNLDTAVSGGISGFKDLVKVGQGIFTLSGYNSYAGSTLVQNGTFILNGYAPGNVLVSPGAVFGGTSRIGNLVNNGTVVPGSNGTGSMQLSGYSGSGALTMNMNGLTHSSLNVDGNATLSGGTLNITGANFLIGSYSIITARSVTGTFSIVNVPATTFLDFRPLYESDDVLLLINTAARFSSVAQNPNERATADALDSSPRTASSNFTTAINALSLLSVDNARAAVQQMSGDSLASFQSIHLRSSNRFSESLQDRGQSLRENSQVLSSSVSYRLWSRGTGSYDHVKRDASVGSPSSDVTSSGFQAGYDFFSSEHVVLGFSAGYLRSTVHIDDRSSVGSATAIESGLYGSYAMGMLFLNWSIVYAGNKDALTRAIFYPGINAEAHADIQGHDLASYSDMGTRLQVGKYVVEPSLSLRQNHLYQAAFTESGAPGLDLGVEDKTLDSLVSAAGLQISREVFKRSPHAVTWGAHAFWQHELATTESSVTALFAETSGGQNFTVRATPRNRNAADLGLNTKMTWSTNLDLYANYRATLGSAEILQAIFGGISIRWD